MLERLYFLFRSIGGHCSLLQVTRIAGRPASFWDETCRGSVQDGSRLKRDGGNYRNTGNAM